MKTDFFVISANIAPTVETFKPEYDWETNGKKPLRHVQNFSFLRPPQSFFPLEHSNVRNLWMLGEVISTSKSSPRKKKELY
jgi:hypothetical protein